MPLDFKATIWKQNYQLKRILSKGISWTLCQQTHIKMKKKKIKAAAKKTVKDWDRLRHTINLGNKKQSAQSAKDDCSTKSTLIFLIHQLKSVPLLKRTLTTLLCTFILKIISFHSLKTHGKSVFVKGIEY